jgi:hypothetical protein
MPKNNVPDLQSLVDKIAKLYYRIEKLSELISLDSLPSVNVDNEKVFEALPHKASCVYFLTHAEQGLLYIGKAYDLKQRFKYHGHIRPALSLKNVRLFWLELPCELLAICEDVLIAGRTPRWNKRIPLSSSMNANQFRTLRGAWTDKSYLFPEDPEDSSP